MAISSTPAYPVPDDDVTLSATATSGNVLVWRLTSVPPTSKLKAGFLFDKEQASVDLDSAIKIAQAKREHAIFTPDVAGEYGFTVYDLRRLPSLPSFVGDPAGDAMLQLLGTQTGTINVGALIDLPIATTPGHDVTLRLTVVDETVRAAELVNASTERARIAGTQASVTTALAALVGVTVAAIGGSEAIETRANNLRTNYEAHRVLTAGAVHDVADTTNKVVRDAADSREGALELILVLSTEILDHLEDASSAGTRWHSPDDWKNLPLTSPGTTLASATVHLADLRERVYERHRVQIANPDTHGAADSTNALTAPSKLDDLIVAYLDVIAALDPSAPAGESEGAQDAAHRYGFAAARDEEADTTAAPVVITGGTSDASGAGVTRNVTTVTAAMSPYTPTASDYILACDSTTGAITITWPPSLGAGRIIEVKDSGGNAFANNVTVNAAAGQTINGASNYVVTADWESVVLCQLTTTSVGIL